MCLAVPPWQGAAINAGACLFGVADGMGGHAAGEVASMLAVKAAYAWLQKYSGGECNVQAMEQIFSDANQSVWDYTRDHPELAGMGTTLSVLLVQGTKLLLGHVGDSRVYRFRNGVFEQLTKDHTLVSEQMRMGRITPEDARKHPARHILSRAMGVREFIPVDTEISELLVGDVYLLCSDGVTGMLKDEEIVKILQESDFRRVAIDIVNAANESGGKDNSTAVLFRVDDLPVKFPSRFSFQRLIQVWQHGGGPFCA